MKNRLLEFATEVVPARQAKCQNEAQTRSYLIDPFLCLIGWNTHDPNQVCVEFTPEFAKPNENVDYALLQDNQPIVLIEAKSVGIQLPPKPLDQLQRYVVFTESCQIAALTNGMIWHWYRQNPEDRRLLPMAFLEFDLADTNFPSDLALRWIEVLKSRPIDLKILGSISQEIVKEFEEAKVNAQTRVLDVPLVEGIEMLQHKSNRPVAPGTGWHLTKDRAPKLFALIEENGTASQRQVLTPKSGLILLQARGLIEEVWKEKHGKAKLEFFGKFVHRERWTLKRVRLGDGLS